MSFFDRYMLTNFNDFFRQEMDDAPATIFIANPNSGDHSKQVANRGGMLNAKLDLLEKPESFLVNVELPGVKKEDIQIHVENGVLEISAERKDEKKEDRDRYHYTERRYGSIRRVISLPEQADADDVKAEFENGVLSLNFMKKKEVVNRKQISIA